jgi:group I intron endonuclease
LLLKRLDIKPIFYFDNLDQKETQELIKKTVEGLQGIYMIINLITEDYYIGSASTNRFYARFSNHLIYFRGSSVVKASVKKYGLNNFMFVVLDLFPYPINQKNNKELLLLEDRYLKTYIPNYNILTEAGNSFGYKHSDITRQKMRDNYSNERREFIRNLNKNKQFSETTIAKLREIALNRPPMSEETKLKCVTHQRTVTLKVSLESGQMISADIKENLIYIFPNIKIAAKCCNCSYKTIQRALNLGYLYIPKELIEFFKNNQNLSAHQILMENYSFPYNALVKNKMLNGESQSSNPKLNKKIFNSGLTLSKGDNKIKCIVC